MNIKSLIQWILLLWFVALSAAVLIPSYQMLFGRPSERTTGKPPDPPVPPPAPVLSFGAQSAPAEQQPQLEAYKQQAAVYAEQVKSYTQEVAVYTQQVAAYKAQEDANHKSGRASVYELVVKNSLVTLMGTFATALIGYVFANLGAGLLDNYVRMKNSEAPQPLSLL